MYLAQLCAISYSPPGRKVLGFKNCGRRGPYGGACGGASSSRCSAGRRHVAAAARAQQPERMRRIGVLLGARTIRKAGSHRRHSCRSCGNWVGPSAATCGSTIAGPSRHADRNRRTQRNWSRSRRTSSWLWHPDLGAFCRRPAPYRSCSRSSPTGWRRLRRQPGATGRQRHRLHQFRIQYWREMAGTAQADRATRDASGGPSGSRQTLGLPVERHPDRGAIIRGGGDPINLRDASEIERAISAFARSANGGLIVTRADWR